MCWLVCFLPFLFAHVFVIWPCVCVVRYIRQKYLIFFGSFSILLRMFDAIFCDFWWDNCRFHYGMSMVNIPPVKCPIDFNQSTMRRKSNCSGCEFVFSCCSAMISTQELLNAKHLMERISFRFVEPFIIPEGIEHVYIRRRHAPQSNFIFCIRLNRKRDAKASYWDPPAKYRKSRYDKWS